MATNKLFEAASDILSRSHSSAPADPPKRLEGEVQDLGGPTNKNAHPMNHAEKISAGEKATDHSARNKASIAAKPSAASTDIQNKLKNEDYDFDDYTLEEIEDFMMSEDFEQLDELSKKTLGSYVKKASDDATKSAASSTSFAFRSTAAKNRRVKDAAAKISDEEEARKEKRLSGIGKAVSRLSKEDYEETLDLSEDINSMFGDEQISEEFRSKVTTIFEARVFDRIEQIQEQLESEYASMLEEAVESVSQDLTEKVNDYLSYVVEQWIADNEIAIESGLRSELTEEFIAGLRNLFAEHYIDVPSEKVDVVEELATKVEELEMKLNEEIEYGIEMKKALVEAVKSEITYEVADGLTDTQVEKIKSLAESVEFSTEDEYRNKLETIRENYFPSGVKKASTSWLHEQVEDEGEQKSVSADPYVQSVMQAISKTKQ